MTKLHRFKKKSWLISGIALALILSVVTVSIIYCLSLKKAPVDTSFVYYVNNDGELPYLYKLNKDGEISDADFKIIAFTDTHLTMGDSEENLKTLAMLRNNIEAEKPDLVIFTGDIATGAFNSIRVKELADIMEVYKIYWAPVFGNHDSEPYTFSTRQMIIDTWSGYDYCLIEKGEVDGCGNYIINIKSSENTISQSLVFIDSGEYLSDADKVAFDLSTDGSYYGYIKPSQIQWYTESIVDIKAEYGEATKSLMFMHIPLVEYLAASLTGEIISGERREEVCSSPHNSGMFEAILATGSTQAVFSGHDHVNDFDALYRGIHLIYNQPSGYTAYDMKSRFGVGDEGQIQGTTVITVHKDGSYTLEKKLNTRFE